MMKIGFIITDNAADWNNGIALGDLFLQRYSQNCNYENIEFQIFYAFNEDLPNEKKLHEYLGFVISGSHYSVNDELPWMLKLESFIKKLFNLNDLHRPKLYGTCFGHQIIAKALGGKVSNNQVGRFVFGSEIVKINKKLRKTSYFSKILGKKKKAFRIMESHGEEVTQIPMGASCVGSSGSCSNEILMYGDCILSSQGHPEGTEHIMKTKMLPPNDKFNEKQVKTGLRALKLADTDILVKLVIEFLTS